MAEHLIRERRRFARVAVPPAVAQLACLPAVVSPAVTRGGGASASGALLPVPVLRAKLTVFREPVLRLVGLAGLGLALFGGLTFVAVRLAAGSAAWVPGRNGDAVTT